MKKKITLLALSAATLAGGASLASCGNANTGNGWSDLDVAINYTSGTKVSGVSYQMQTATTLDYANLTLTKGTTLPTWKAIGDSLNLNIRDASVYTSALKDDWQQYDTSGYKDNNNNMIDLVMGQKSVYQDAQNLNHLVAISDHLNEMPNFKAWVQSHQSIFNSMKFSDGKVYYTPYFDGLDTQECMPLMNKEMVEKLLDGEASQLNEDTVIAADKISYNKTVNEVASAEETVKIYNPALGGAQDVTIKFAQNAVENQNALAEGGLTGREAVSALKAALLANYGHLMSSELGGTGSVFKKYSEIFTSQAACYNVDDLVALWRAVYTNSTLLAGAGKKVTVFAPRTGQNNRTKQVAQLLQFWGVRGVAGENGMLYFDGEGNLKDARTQESTYEALEYLNDLYTEGLIQKDFFTDPDNKEMGSSEFRKKYMKDGSLFMLYDYNTTTAQYNKDADSATYKVNMEAVLPPFVKWNVGNTPIKYKNEVVHNYFHFTEDNRALKDGGWAIPATTDNLEGALACMDYLFSQEGANLQDYGPEAYIDDAGKVRTGVFRAGLTTVNGSEVVIKISDAVLNAIKNSSYGWNDYYRLFIGATQGIGHVRSAGLDIECNASAKAIAALNEVGATQAAGAYILAQSTVDANTSRFFLSVPTSAPLTTAENQTIKDDAHVKAVDNFWNYGQSKTIWIGARFIVGGWTETNVVSAVTDYNTLKGHFTGCDAIYLTAWARAINTLL